MIAPQTLEVPSVGGTVDFRNYVADARHYARNVIPFLIVNPFDLHSDGLETNENAQALRSIIELQADEIIGLTTGWVLYSATGVVENPTHQVEYVLSEKYGRIMEAVLHAWMMDYSRAYQLGETLPVATVMFIEPDATYTKVVSAWRGENMFPLNTGNQSHGRNANRSSEPAIIKPRFSGRFTYNTVEALEDAQRLLDTLITNGTGLPPETQL